VPPKKKKELPAPAESNLLPEALLQDLRGLIEASQQRVATAINSEMTMLFWEMGERIRKDILQEKRASYGEEIISALATRLSGEFGRSFNKRNLFHMVLFVELFPSAR
jgi:hypothetical protein